MTLKTEKQISGHGHAESVAERRRFLAGAAGTALALAGFGGLRTRSSAAATRLPDTLVAFAGVGLNTSDLEASRAFYRDGLGLKEFLILPPPPGTSANVEAVFTRSGLQDDGAILTLANRPVIASMYPALAPTHGRPSFGRLTSAAADASAILARLHAAGYRTVSFGADADKFSESGTFGHAHITFDPDGYVVEIFTGAVTDLVPGAVKATSNSAPSLVDRFIGLELNVSDVGRSLHFYKDVLGMHELMQIPEDTTRTTASKVALTISGTLQGGVLVLAPITADASATRTGFGRVLCQSADPAGAVQRLSDAGFTQTVSAAGKSGDPSRLRVIDPDGFQVELFSTLDKL